jgi:hypothetical protein
VTKARRSPARAAVLWGVVGFVAGLVITLALAFAKREPGEPDDAMFERGEASAPIVLVAAAVPAAIAYVVTKSRQQ